VRIRILHETRYGYDAPASYTIQTLRVTPRSHDGQFVCRWRIDIDADCVLARDEDPFGNVTHTFTVDSKIDALTVAVEGEVETEDRAGFVRGTVERLPPTFWLRETDLTVPSAELRTFAEDIAAGEGGDTIATMHALMREFHRIVRFDATATTSSTTAAEAFAAKHGVCQDFAHMFTSAARALGVPARYVSGYLFKGPGEVTQEAGHAWVEVFLDGLGWVGFDAANAVCVTDHHIRVAVGLDCLGAAPVRGARVGGSGEHLGVKVTVEPAVRVSPPLPTLEQSQSFGWGQSQRQSQG
jgi:transglutaminase-like putative cysteine protease